ncbi:MAG: CHAT domain-containing protein, partial [Catenulispora sp.]|nr:CHAT domain-containing protein [Catenulispora sp.]
MAESVAPGRADIGTQGARGTPGTFEFLIEVGDRIADGYRLTFAYPDPDSPTGTGGHSSLAPLDPADAALRSQLATLPTMVLASAARSRLAVSPMEQAARAVGDHLFRALTGGETLGELARLRRRAQAVGADVRLALRVRPPELAALPWEFLFDARADRAEFLGRSCMVTRSAGDLRAVPPLTVAGPLRVLAMVAVPSDQAELDVERERAYLEQSLAPMRAAGRLELEWIPATKTALLAATQRRRWHIVHYIGHGDFDPATGAGRLAFAAEDGAGTDWVTARQLATILGAHPTLRLVVLNACQSSAASAEDGQAGLAAALVHAGLAAVVAMQFPITDDAAPVFGREFYGALAAGEPVDRCVRAGRAAITLANDASLEWGTPVLHLRSTDGVLFAMQDDASWHTAAPPTDPEPWRPEPEPEPEPHIEENVGTGRHALLQQIGLDLMHAKAKILDEHYSEELVADLERIVEGYRGLHGPEHQDTISARRLLIKARESLAAAGPTRWSFADLFVKPGPAVPADDPEDQPRSKTTRRGSTERPPRAPRSSKAAF